MKTNIVLSLTLAGVEAANQKLDRQLFMWSLGPIHVSDEEPLLSSDESMSSDEEHPNIIPSGGPPYVHGDFLVGSFTDGSFDLEIFIEDGQLQYDLWVNSDEEHPIMCDLFYDHDSGDLTTSGDDCPFDSASTRIVADGCMAVSSAPNPLCPVGDHGVLVSTEEEMETFVPMMTVEPPERLESARSTSSA